MKTKIVLSFLLCAFVANATQEWTNAPITTLPPPSNSTFLVVSNRGGVATPWQIPASSIATTQRVTAIANGILSSNDWQTFNAKQAALGYTPATNSQAGIDSALGYIPQPASGNLSNWSSTATSAKQDALGYVPATNSQAGINAALGYIPQPASSALSNYNSAAFQPASSALSNYNAAAFQPANSTLTNLANGNPFTNTSTLNQQGGATFGGGVTNSWNSSIAALYLQGTNAMTVYATTNAGSTNFTGVVWGDYKRANAFEITNAAGTILALASNGNFTVLGQVLTKGGGATSTGIAIGATNTGFYSVGTLWCSVGGNVNWGFTTTGPVINQSAVVPLSGGSNYITFNADNSFSVQTPLFARSGTLTNNLTVQQTVNFGTNQWPPTFANTGATSTNLTWIRASNGIPNATWFGRWDVNSNAIYDQHIP